MVDYEDQLAHEFEEARDELYKQVTSLTTKMNLLWEVVRSMVVFFIPVIGGIGISFLIKSYLPGTLAALASTVFNGITIGLVFLNLVPLSEAITNYLDCKVYTPNFVNCTCKKCHDRNNCSDKEDAVKDQGEKAYVEAVDKEVKEGANKDEGEYVDIEASNDKDSESNGCGDNARNEQFAEGDGVMND